MQPKKSRRGFTLMEVLIASSIVAVLATIAVPEVGRLVRSSRVAAQIDGFVADLRFARGQAIRRGQTVGVCASADGQRCAGNADWHQGWIVFVDVDGDGLRALHGDEALLRSHPAWGDTDRFVGGEASAISYARSGFTRGMRGPRITLTLHAGGTPTRCISVDRVGRTTLLQRGELDCG